MIAPLFLSSLPWLVRDVPEVTARVPAVVSVPKFRLSPETKLRLVPALVPSDVVISTPPPGWREPRVRLSILASRISSVTDPGTVIVTLYVVMPPLLGTPAGVQLVGTLQFPVPPFQEAPTCCAWAGSAREQIRKRK